MNREIKFRVWDGVDYMSNPFSMIDIQNKKIQFASYLTIMQFTGLKDKNGKDIYEGDIIKVEERRWTVRFDYDRDNTGLGWVAYAYNINTPLIKNKHNTHFIDNSITKGEIIGNIYEIQNS